MSKKRGCLYIFLGLILLFMVFVALQFRHGNANFVGKDTTILTSPLRDDGTVDYASAINKGRLQDAPPEKNALTGLLPYSKEFYNSPLAYQRDFVQAMGLVDIPIAIEFNEPYGYIASKLDAKYPTGIPVADQEYLDYLMDGLNKPWKSSDFPKAAEAIKQYEDEYQNIIEASKQPKFFHPLISLTSNNESTPLFGILLPCVQNMRSFARAFSARSLNQLAEGDIPGAIESAKTIRRLASLCSQSETAIEKLVANATFGIGMQVEKQLLHSGRLSQEQLTDYQTFLDTHPIPDDLADRLGKFERYSTLDIVQLARNGSLDGMMGPGRQGQSSAVFKFALRSLKIGEVMRQCNKHIDALTEALRVADKKERLQRLNQFEASMVEMEEDATQPWRYMLTAKSRSQYAGNVLMAMLCPSFLQVQQSDFRLMMQHEVTKAAFAIERFKADTGSYPDKLEDLVPDYCKTLPMDPVENSALHYKKTVDGMMLYSFGTDGVDDGGLAWDEITNGNHLKGDIRYLVGAKPTPQVDSPLARKDRIMKAMQREKEREKENQKRIEEAKQKQGSEG